MKQTSEQKNYYQLILISLWGAFCAGMTMAVINVFFEIMRGNSIIHYKHLGIIALWHAFVWSFWGIVQSIVLVIVSIFRKNPLFKNIYSLIYLNAILGFWLTFFMYFNFYYVPPGINVQSLLWNTLLLVIGAVLIILVIKYTKRFKPQKILFSITFYASLLLLIILVSLTPDFRFMKNRGNADLTEETLGQQKKLNVIIITLDAVRADHLGCYGYGRNTSPNIDAFAHQGVIFEKAFSQASVTNESVASLFSATYPSYHNMRTRYDYLPERIVVLPQIFQRAGYKTALFSLNPLISPVYGYHKGVDYFFGTTLNVTRSTILWALLERIQQYFPASKFIIAKILKWSESLFQHQRDLESDDPNPLTQKITSWISQHKSDPFFIYAHYMGGHAPYNPPSPYNKIFDPEFPDSPVISHPEINGVIYPFRQANAMAPANMRNMIAQYDGEIFYHDLSIGYLVAFLKNADLENKTIVVITADHGEEFYEHKNWGHGFSVFDESIHVPLIFRGPGIISGKRITSLAAHIDILPTLVAQCGIQQDLKLPYKIDGTDLSPALFSKGYENTRKYILSEFRYLETSVSGFRTEEHKAIKMVLGNERRNLFFDLNSDPFEKKDIYNEKSSAQGKLFSIIDSFTTGAERLQPQKVVVTKKTIEELKALGYVK
jgi:arylsulfatase A-like enzyme